MMDKFPIVAVTGPRQSGKTTLVKHLFEHKPFVSLEDPDIQALALSDPRGFLARFPEGAVLDEAQRAPHLFSYIQTMVDDHGSPGRFLLTGSQHFLLMENLSQSLAGRVYIAYLLPLSLEELQQNGSAPASPTEYIFSGTYPGPFARQIAPADWYPSYIQTYLERDVRLIKNIGDLSTFHQFLKMCAARTGQLLNLSSLANDCGITHNTAKSWLGILEATFIIHLLPPYYRNFNKRLVKCPKLYFHDTGLACSLLGVENHRQLETHAMKGALFETAMVAELFKRRAGRGLPPNLYFWRDKTGNEIDLILEKGSTLIPIEIKSGKTITDESLKGLAYWDRISSPGPSSCSYLIYAGEEEHLRHATAIVPWKMLGQEKMAFD